MPFTDFSQFGRGIRYSGEQNTFDGARLLRRNRQLCYDPRDYASVRSDSRRGRGYHHKTDSSWPFLILDNNTTDDD